jgi:hypothetical protein
MDFMDIEFIMEEELDQLGLVAPAQTYGSIPTLGVPAQTSVINLNNVQV